MVLISGQYICGRKMPLKKACIDSGGDSHTICMPGLLRRPSGYSLLLEECWENASRTCGESGEGHFEGDSWGRGLCQIAPPAAECVVTRGLELNPTPAAQEQGVDSVILSPSDPCWPLDPGVRRGISVPYCTITVLKRRSSHRGPVMSSTQIHWCLITW